MTITPDRLQELRQSGNRIDLIDVRTPAEFRAVHSEPARNVPLDRLDPPAVMAARNGNDQEPLYLICRSGSRAAKAQKKFQAAGFQDVVLVEGGTEAWEKAGLPVVRGKGAISLERQVRIAAGLLVLAGVILGWVLHPAWAALSAFVGGGLVFAGLTDTCGMAMLLAKMPWNRGGVNSQSRPDEMPDAACTV